MRKQRGREWDTRVQVFQRLATRIHCDPGWTSAEAVFLLTSKQEFARVLDVEINVIHTEAKSKKVHGPAQGNRVASVLQITSFQLLTTEFADSLTSKR